MIICESKEYIDSIAQEVGVSCIDLNLLQIINESVGITISQANDLLSLQAGIYALILSYMWVVVGVRKVDD